MRSQEKYDRKSVANPALPDRLILLLISVLITSAMMTACNQGAAVKIPDEIDPGSTPTPTTVVEAKESPGDAPEGVDEMQLDAQQADELAIVEAEGEAQGQIETEAKIEAGETAVARGFSEREDFFGPFIGKWVVEGQPARQVIVVLREDDTAELSTQQSTDPNESTADTGAWNFEGPGVATLSLDASGDLELRFVEDLGFFLRGGEFGHEGLAMTKVMQ